MALDDFKSEDEDDSTDVSTRKKIENVKLDKEQWKYLLSHNPSWASYFANHVGESSAKAIYQTLDDILEDGVRGVKLTDDEKEKVRKEKEEVLDVIERRF